MKRAFLLLLLVLSVLCTGTSAHDSGWGRGTRVMSFNFNNATAYISGDSVMIDSPVTLTNVEIVITDSSNNVVSDEYVTVYGGKEYCYPINVYSSGIYKIQMYVGGTSQLLYYYNE
jgi:hypothetical protein